MIKLTPKRESFALLVASGETQSDAYRGAYNTKASDKTIWKRSGELIQNGAVRGRIEELKAERVKQVFWTREDSIRELSEIALRKAHIDKNTGEVTPGAKDNDRIAAIKELNGMEGFNAPVKQEHVNIDKKPMVIQFVGCEPGNNKDTNTE